MFVVDLRYFNFDNFNDIHISSTNVCMPLPIRSVHASHVCVYRKLTTRWNVNCQCQSELNLSFIWRSDISWQPGMKFSYKIIYKLETLLQKTRSQWINSVVEMFRLIRIVICHILNLDDLPLQKTAMMHPKLFQRRIGCNMYMHRDRINPEQIYKYLGETLKCDQQTRKQTTAIER